MSETSPAVQQRTELLETFAEYPEADDLWETAYSLVRGEASISPPDSDYAIASDIPGEELIAFAAEMRCTSQADRYALTTRMASNNRQWFDVLKTFSSQQIEQAKRSFLSMLADRGYPTDTMLDVGTGTGNSLPAMEGVAGRIIGVDKNPLLLDIAQERKARHTSLVVADVTALPLASESIDVASSSGLEGALDQRTSTQFYRELSRVLIAGGIYFSASYYPNAEGYTGAEMAAVTASSKAMLADMIVDSVSGRLARRDSLSDVDRQSLLAELGLTQEYLLMEHDGEKCETVTVVDYIQKTQQDRYLTKQTYGV